MRALLSAVGTRGDVQPVIALAIEVRKLGHDVHLCVPPNFVEWIDALGFPVTSVGVEMRAPRPGTSSPPPTMLDLIADQFAAIGAVANGHDIILGANAHQYAAPSIAEFRGIPYVSAVYAPTALPNDTNTLSWNERALARVNANRGQLGLAPIGDVLRQIITEHPWLAFDTTLAPMPSVSSASKTTATQTGAWILEDRTPLPADLDEFLAAGEPPVYFGFGSMPVAAGTSRTLIEAARAMGRRAIVSRGWAGLGLIDRSPDCIAIGDVNQQALFPRMAAVVHHGGAGTTHAAALAGASQVIMPMFSDQPFWASRVRELGIGTSLPIAELTVDRLSSALQVVISPQIAERAGAIAARIARDGAAVAARHLVDSAN